MRGYLLSVSVYLMNKSDHNKPQSGYDEMATEMLRGFKVLDADGQNSGIAGHLTARIGDTDQLLGHQYGLSFDEVGLADIRLARFDLAEAKQKLVSPSLAFHVALYQARPDIGAIVHTHPDQVIAFSATGSRFNPVFQSALMLYRKVQHYDDYDGIVESNALGQKFARHLGDGQILLLKNHGLISVGKTIADAICAAVIFHQNCRIQLTAMVSGRVLGFDEDESQHETLQQASDFLASEQIVKMRFEQLVRATQKSIS